MATMETKKNQNGINIKIPFMLNGQRKKLCLGSRYTVKRAEEIKSHVEKIAQAIETGNEIGKSTAGFIEELTDDLKQRFIACGLLVESADITNAELFKRFVADSVERKQSTLLTYTAVKNRYLAFFPKNGHIRNVTKKDGERWKAHLKKEGYSEASIAGSFKRMNAVFNWAVEQDYLDANPFKGIRKGSMVNEKRMFYVPMDWYEKLLDACPCQTWRTLIALCRIGGLRNPSETLRLTWQDVDFGNRSILVHCSKTEHHAGKETRLIPMFPKLEEELKAQWELTEEGGSPYVIAEYRDTAANMRTQFRRIIFRAGLDPWERTFQNLRESRANEIWSEYPRHVAAAWMGHSERVAMKHYLQVTDEQFQKALKKKPDEGISESTDLGTHLGTLTR